MVSVSVAAATVGVPGTAVCAVAGVITEVVAVRPVLKSLDQHLYVLSTLAALPNRLESILLTASSNPNAAYEAGSEEYTVRNLRTL